MSKVAIDEILDLLKSSRIDFNYKGSCDLVLDSIRSLSSLKDGAIGFCRGNDSALLEELNSFGCLLIIKSSIKISTLNRSNLLFVDNPDLAICLIGNLFLPKIVPGIHSTAVIHPEATIHESSWIAANVVVANDVIVGPNTCIEEGSVLKHCTIGENSHIFPGVKIGSSGLGSHRDNDGRWHHFPHLGRVLIGSNVTIQDNCSIARGTLNNTIIEDGVVIGPLSWIAHGVLIKKNAFIGQSVTVAGSVVVSEDAIIWGNASIRDGVKIGMNSVVGMGTVVVKHVPDNVTVIGNPAKIK